MIQKLSAIVLNYRSPKDTARCVQSLLAQSMIDDMEILIVDNHSDDESVAMHRARFADHPRIRIIEERDNLGFGKANNHAANMANGEYLLFINPDNAMPQNGAEELLKILEEHPKAGIVAPALVHGDGSVRPSARAFPSLMDPVKKRLSPSAWHKQYAKKLEQMQEVQEVDWVVGACFLIKKQVFAELGGFDPRFFLFFEDTDLCRRVKESGKSVLYAPHIKVADQKKRLSDGGILSIIGKKTTRIHIMSALKYFWKWKYSA